MASSRGRLRAQVKQWASRPEAELREVFGPWVELPDDWGNPQRRRFFPPATSFWLFLAQVLSADGSCRETLRAFQAGLFLKQGKTASPNTAGYCRARAKLYTPALKRISQGAAEKIENRADAWRWHGRPVKVVDGSGLSMPDTPQNQKAWPQPQKAKPGCGFPVMRIVALFSLATGVILNLAHGALTVHERTLFQRLWPWLEKGDVLLADRGFGSFADFFLLARRGVDCVMRKNARRKNAAMIRRIHRNDRLVEWQKSGPCPRWLDEETWQKMPERMTVREIKVSVPIPGFRTETLWVVTTLLDPRTYSARDLAELYRRRWQVELFLRDIKITLKMDVLRCLTPAMVEKELWMRLIAYNLIRALMTEAALAHGLTAERISFKGTVSTLRTWAPILAQAQPQPSRYDLYRRMLDYLVQDRLPKRPGRVEPRARKRRPKNYQLLNQPRKIFREILHRNKYRRA